MFWTQVVEKIKTHILTQIIVFIKPCPLLDNVGKILNALLRFHCNNGYAKAPHFYVIVTLPILKGF